MSQVNPLLPFSRHSESSISTSRIAVSRIFIVLFLAGSCLVSSVLLFHRNSLSTWVLAAKAADKPWGIDFDIKYAQDKHQWQITNLVLHPPPPPPAAGEEPPKVMTKPTFPFFELQAMNTADADVKKKLSQKDIDPKLKEKIEEGMKMKSSALDSAVGCPEGSEPGSSIKTACPGVGSGKPQEVKRQWNMGFPPQEGNAAQQSSAYKYRGLSGGDVDRGQTDE
jgi:hypothetical protein